ncbi:MAG: hypothetical protein KGY67_08920 [Candidatus Thermoplasmatota archaeon]|nr:hypothetical protein [Candidatus Thermoplasmatota archaeon]
MDELYDDEYIQICRNHITDCLEIRGKTNCEKQIDFERSMNIINQFVKRTNAKKIVFYLVGFNTLGDESFISKEFLPVLGVLGVKHIAVITGHDDKTKVYFEELGFYNSSVKQEYDIKAEHFESFDEGINWIKEQ